MSDHRTSTTAPTSIGELSKNIVEGLSQDRAVATAMRQLESRMHDLYNMTMIMSDLVFDTFAGSPKSNEEGDRALFSVNEVVRRVGEFKEAYLAAWDAEAGDDQPEAARRPSIINLIGDVEASYERWMGSVLPEADLPDNDHSKAFTKAQFDLIYYPCRSYHDVVAKAAYMHDQETKAAKTVFITFCESMDGAGFLLSLLGKEA